MVASLVYHRLSLWVEITGCGRSLSGIHGDGVGLTEPAFVWQVVLKQRDILLLLSYGTHVELLLQHQQHCINTITPR